jgi:hypothetical protein
VHGRGRQETSRHKRAWFVMICMVLLRVNKLLLMVLFKQNIAGSI